ncbi:MAG TPA: DUF6079 family protein [Candidatus Paceibacterota bacterium]|nr:DUF6079 family protein [Candidatus Paceibacterota bacterium]
MNYRELIQFDSAVEAPPEEQAPSSLREVIVSRLVRRTPEQQALVVEHLAKFPDVTGERLGEFVELFPFHPDVLALVEKITFIAKPVLAQILADAAKKILDEPVPQDHPGFIAADAIWGVIRHNHALRKVSEIEVVVYCSGLLEKRISRKFKEPEQKQLALRVARALAVHRLASDDIYSHDGATAVELCHLLCLQRPGVEPEKLLADVTEIINRIHHFGGSQFICSNHETGRHYLQIKKFKRFVKPELLLHWVNATPFLILMLTGGTMLASRFFDVVRDWMPWVKFVHQFCAAMWLIAMPPTIMLRLNVHWQHIRVVLKWGKEDLLWMVQSMRVAYNKNAAVPPADRFNTGQKINAVLVLMYFFGFGSTGLLMFFKGSILLPWYIHTALFFSAVGSVGGHMFLAMINPSTRIALMGIFHGWVPLKYVEHHHPLSLPKSLQSHLHPPSKKTLLEEIAISRIEVIMVVVMALMAGGGALAFNTGMLKTAKSHFAKSFSDTVSPAKLSMKHRVGPTAESCTKCHAYTGEIPNSKCEECHQDIKERRLKTIGYHGTLKEDCRTCHQEHPDVPHSIVPLDREKFDHSKAAFKRDGKHEKIDCDECHKKKRTPEMKGIYYVGLKFDSCAECHKDQHNAQFTVACDTCHVAAGWQRPNLKFSHETNSVFKLEGKHQTVDCAKCHKPKTPESALGTATFKGLQKECQGCHEEPHRKQFADKACTACHVPKGWQREFQVFNHNRDAKFQLVAKHTEVACEKCHKPAARGDKLAAAQMRGLKSGCADCHQDPHNAQFKTDCTRCHQTPDAFKVKQLRFDHNRDTKFPIAGKHVDVKCIKCHRPQDSKGHLASARFVGLDTDCASCHKVKHPAEYGASCLSCHTVNGWTKKKPAPDHASKNEVNNELLLGKHITTRCDSCHNQEKIPAITAIKEMKRDCLTCHTKDEPHKGTLGTTCFKCHSTEGWKGEYLRFKHDTMTHYPLNQDHRNVACAKCHKDNHWKPLDTSCVSCHPKYGESNPGAKIQTIQQ